MRFSLPRLLVTRYKSTLIYNFIIKPQKAPYAKRYRGSVILFQKQLFSFRYGGHLAFVLTIGLGTFLLLYPGKS